MIIIAQMISFVYLDIVMLQRFPPMLLHHFGAERGGLDLGVRLCKQKCRISQS